MFCVIQGDASTHGSRVGPSLLYDYRENFTTDKVSVRKDEVSLMCKSSLRLMMFFCMHGQVFATNDGLIEWARSTGQQHGLIIVIKASEKVS